jgi:autotransporter-associated beta strand protein
MLPVGRLSRRALRGTPDALFRVSAAALSLFALFGFNPQTLAATDTWTGASGTSTDWATATNWSYSTGSGPVASGDALIFTGTNGAGTTTLTDSLTNSSFSIAGITFTSSAPAYIMTGNAFAVSAGLLDDSANTETINNAIAFPATHSITAGAAGSSLVFGGVLSGAGGITVNGPGSVTLDAANTYTGITTVASGSLTENFAAAGAPANNIIATNSVLTLGGGTLKIVGASGVANTQAFASTTFTAGQSTISAAPSSGSTLPTVSLGAITGVTTAGVSVEYTGPATIGASNVAVPATATITTTTAGLGAFGAYAYNNNNILVNGGATVGLYDWASSDTTAGTAGTSPYTIIGGSQVTGFYQTTGITTTTAAYDYNPSGTNTLGNAVGSPLVRFNNAGPGTITSTATTAQDVYGFLVTPNVGANNDTLTGSGLEFARDTNAVQVFGTIWQNNTLGYLNVALSLQPGKQYAQNNGLIQNGAGTVVYTGANAYELSTYLNGGYSVVTADNGFGNVGDAGTVVHDAPGETELYLNGGTVVGNASFTMDNAGSNKRPITLLANGGGLAATAGATMTVDGLIESTVANNLPLVIGIPASAANGNVEGLLPGSGAGTANTTAVMATGTVVLNAGNGYFGGTVLDSGVLNINGINALGGANYGGIILNGGTLQYATGATGNGSLDLTSIGTAGVGVSSLGGTIDVNGNAVTYAGSIGNGGSGPLTVKSSASGGSLTLSAANTFTGALILSSGALTLSAANVNTGLTSINGGTLTLASGGSLGNTAVTVAAGAKLQANTGNGGIGSGSGASLTLAGGSGTTGATLSMVGDSAAGVLNLSGGLTIGGSAGAANLDFEINSTSADELVVSGGVLGGAGAGVGAGTIFITALGTTAPANGQQYTLISAASGLGTSLFALGTTSFTYGTQSYTLSLSASTGTAEILTANFASLNYYWTGNSNVSWGTLANFATDHTGATTQSTALGSTSNVFETADTATGFTQTLNGSYTINSLNFTGASTAAAGSGVTISNGTGTNILTISAANSYSDVNSNNYGPGVGLVVQAGSAAHTISANVDLGNSQTWQINNSSANPLTVTGVIADGSTLNGLTKSGAGTLILENANTYDGGTTVTGGILQLGTGGSLSSTGVLTIEGTGTFDLDGNSQAVTGLADGGVATGTLTSTSGTPILTINNASTNTFGGAISGSLGITANGSSTLTLSGVNSYTGLTTVNSGNLISANNAALGSSSSATGGLLIDPSTGTVNVEFTSATPSIASLASSGAGTSNVILGGLTGTGSATNLTVGGGGATTVFNGVISDETSAASPKPAGIGSLTVSGGSLTLNAADTYTGNTAITGGTLILGNALALQDSTLNYSGAGALSFGTLTAATFTGLTGSGNLALTNAASTPAGVILTLGNNNVTSSFSGNLSGLGGVSKIGTGALTLNDATYSGNTVVYGGTLNFGSSTNLTTHLDISADYNVAAVTITGGTLVSNSGLYITSPTGGTGTIYGNSATLAITGGAQVTVNADASGRGISYGDGNGRPGGNGSLTIGAASDTSTLVTVNGALDMFYTSGGSTVGNFTTNLNGGTLAVQKVQDTTYGGNQTATFDFNGGTLKSLASDPTGSQFIPLLTGFTVNVEAGGAVINTNGFNDTIAAVLAHGGGTPDGGLTLSDTAVTPGTLTLTGTNTYTGATTINTGATLQLGNGATGEDGTIVTSSGITDDGTLVFNRFGAPSSPVAINGTGGVVKIGNGSQTLSASNGYTGATTIGAGILIVTGALTSTASVTADNGGTVELETSNNVNASAHVTLANGTLETLAGETQSLGDLTLGAGASNLTLGASANIINFANSSADTWTGTLSINDWNGASLGGGSDEVFIGTSADLSAAQLADISFVNPTVDGVSDPGTFGVQQLSDGELVLAASIPEPGDWAGILGGFALLLVWQRSRRRRA